MTLCSRCARGTTKLSCPTFSRAPELAHAYHHWLKRAHATTEARLKQEASQKLELLTEEGPVSAILEPLRRELGALASDLDVIQEGT